MTTHRKALPRKQCRKIQYASPHRARAALRDMLADGRGEGLVLYRCARHLGKPWHWGHPKGAD